MKSRKKAAKKTWRNSSNRPYPGPATPPAAPVLGYCSLEADAKAYHDDLAAEPKLVPKTKREQRIHSESYNTGYRHGLEGQEGKIARLQTDLERAAKEKDTSRMAAIVELAKSSSQLINGLAQAIDNIR